MNLALRISVVIAWLTVISTVNSSHADSSPCALRPLLAGVIEQLSVASVNEITPHVEALANMVKGNDIYHFFHSVEEECHNYKNKVGNKEPSTLPNERNQEKIKESQQMTKGTSDAQKEPLKETNEVSKKETEGAAKEEAPESEGSASDSEGSSGANKTPNPAGRMLLKDLPEGAGKRVRKNNVEIVLVRRGNKVSVTTRKPNQPQKPQKDIDISGKDGEQLTVRKIVDLYTAV